MPQPRHEEPTDWREGRRFRAWELHQQGWKQTAIAAALGVTQGAVSQWLKRGQEAGAASLRRRPAPGAPARLTPVQLTEVKALLAHGAESFGFLGDVWTSKRVAAVIHRHFGVRYHRAHVSRVLRSLGLSVQRPIVRATQRDEAVIAAWWDERWPELKKKLRVKLGRSFG